MMVLQVGWLLLVVAAQIAVFIEMWRFFVRGEHGQLLDTIALNSNTIGADRIGGVVGTVLNAISVLAVVVAACVVGFIALVRRRIALAIVAIVLIGGATLSAQLLKHVIVRPDLGVDDARAGAGNSFPSGHTTIAAAVAVALVLVLPPRVRGVGGIIAAGYAAFVGVATLSAGWHRPSDAVAAFLVVGVWAALAGLVLLAAAHRGDRVREKESHRVVWITLTAIGAVLFVIAAVSLRLTDQVARVPTEELSTRRLAAAYGGSAAGIAAAASLMMALVLATVHRVVPRRDE